MAKLRNKQVKVDSTFDMGGQTLSNIANPTPGSQEAATANYVDAAIGAVDNSVPTTADKGLIPAVCADLGVNVGAPTGLFITATPSNDSYVTVVVNGQLQRVGDGVKTKDCYFSADAGTTAKAIAAIVATDELIWVANAANADFPLDALDVIDLNYNV